MDTTEMMMFMQMMGNVGMGFSTIMHMMQGGRGGGNPSMMECSNG
jgi:hypothetical protein